MVMAVSFVKKKSPLTLALSPDYGGEGIRRDFRLMGAGLYFWDEQFTIDSFS
jgi:hypothetical protein